MQRCNSVRATRAAAVILLFLLPGSTIHAHPDATQAANAAADRVVLISGEVLMGRVAARLHDRLVLRHPHLGELSIPLDSIKSFTVASLTPEPDAAGTSQSGNPSAPTDASLAPEAAAETPAEPAPDAIVEPEPPVKWSGRIELGADGSQGNSDRSSFFGSVGLKREVARTTLALDANYRLSLDDGETTTNRLFNEIRYDRTFAAESPWSYFAQTTQEADEFKDYDFRLTFSNGVSYQFFKEDHRSLRAYAGFGAAREFGGRDDGVLPFGLLGAEYMRRVNGRIVFRASGEFEPRFDEVGEFRARGKSSLDIDLNDTGSMKLRLAIEDEYVSDPGDAKNNDIYYTASIVFTF